MADELRQLQNAPLAPHADICLYGLAMEVRGAADGSCDPAQPQGYYAEAVKYIRARCHTDVWGKSRSLSEARFRNFLLHACREAEAQSPWLFVEART